MSTATTITDSSTTTTDDAPTITARTLRTVAVLALLAQAAIHLQQWQIGFSQVPVVGPMFLANAALAGAAAIGVAVRADRVSLLGGIAVSAGALGALLLAFTIGLFGFRTAGLTSTPILIAIVSEAVAAGALAAYLAVSRR